MSACRSCGAPIEWALTDNNRRMPLDLGSFPDGRLLIAGHFDDGTPAVVVLTGAQLERLRVPAGLELELRRAHFQTCPQAGDWRR